jgi:hypothetical protein
VPYWHYTIVKEHTSTQSRKKRKNQRTKGTIFSKGFIKRIIRKISTSDTGWRAAEDLKRYGTETNHKTEEERDDTSYKTTAHASHKVSSEEKIRRILHKEISRCGDTIGDTEDTVEEWVQGLTKTVQQFGLPDVYDRASGISDYRASKSNNDRTRGGLRNTLREQTKKMIEEHRCTAMKDGGNRDTESDTIGLNSLYTPDELMQWKIIGNKVTQISNAAIDKVSELQNKRAAKEEMTRYIESLCNPDIDTVVCQGVAGSGETFTAMRCAFIALKEGLLEEVLHTRPLVSAGGVGIGFEPGSVGQKL